MLVLSRRSGQGLTVRLNPSIDPSTPVGELLGEVGIRILITQFRGNQVALGVDAPFEFEIVRDELLPAPDALGSDGA